MDLTQRQQEVLAWICEAIRSAGIPPTIREIARHFRFRSPKAASDHVATLVQKGYLSRVPGQSRSLHLTSLAESLFPLGIPLVGNAAAGFPILSEEHIRDHLQLDQIFGDRNLFAVQVQGDSMIDAGIYDGDYVLIRRNAPVEQNGIGLAFVDGEATIKTIRRAQDHVELIPANPLYPVITVQADQSSFEIAGPVAGVIRRF